MSRPRGGPGGLDLNAMMKQVQQMQADMVEAQEKLKDETVDASAGGGMVKVKMSGDLRLLESPIDPEAIDPEDPELLQDMVLAAVNEGIRAAQELASSKLGGVTGGLRAAPASAGSGCPGCSDRLYAQPIQRLIAELAKLPGIGQRTAQRLAFYVLRSSDEDALALADAIREVKEKVGLCEICFNLAEGPRCRICEDDRRDQSVICVVEEPQDVIPIERTHEFRGLYHVLGGALSPIDGIDPEDLKIAELVRPRRGRGRERGGARHEPDHNRRGDRDPHRGPPARQGANHAPGERPAGRRRPRARGRGHAGPRVCGQALGRRLRLSLR